MTDDVASIGGLFASKMGNNESRESEEEDNNDVVASNDGYTTTTAAVAAGGAGRIVDEEEVIHYAAAAEQLLASSSVASDVKQKKKKKRKRKQKEEEELVEEKVEEPVAEMSVASAVAAAAAALKEKATAFSVQSQTAPPPPPAVALEVAVAGGAEKKKRRKKKNRQTSQEEESAQALLALNKGGLGSSEGAENEQAVVDEEGEPRVVVATPTKKRKKRTKKHQVDEVVFEEDSIPTAPSETINQDGDVDMADTLPVSFADTTGVQASVANENDIATIAPTDQTGLQQMEIPDQRIITEHLAAHMAKIAPPEPSAEDLLVEQRLMNELGNIHQSIEGFVSVNHNNHIGDGDHQFMGPTSNNKTATKKRKRLLDNHNSANAPMNELVDPQLMQLDQQAALAAGGDAAVDTNAKGRKRRRATTTSVPAESEETAETAAKKTNRRRTVAPGESKSSWGTTPAGNNGEAVNGGTFSLEERFVIDKALQDYCKVHDMTMDELKDRVWGNNRRKDEFWDTICSAVPNRSRASVYKHVRRSCHIFQQRAKWTAEEDNELADLVKEKGNKWKDIGEAMGRMGEDCRDRYRNYVKCGKDRGTDRWSEEEEKLLKKTVAEHKEISKQVLMAQGKPMPPPEEEDNILINWTTVSDQMENKRSRIQCRYKWKKMLAQKEKFKQAPIGVTYVGGKKKRLTFDIGNMTAGDRQWLLYQIRDSGATQENEIPWDQIAKNDKDVGIWTHKDLKSAYKGFRSHIPHKRRPLSEVIKQLLQELEQYTPEARQQRFIPNPNATAEDAANTVTNPSVSHSPAPGAGASISPTNFEQQIFQMVTGMNAANAPVANMVAAQNSFQPPQSQQQQQQQQQSHTIPTTTADMMVDPELMGQGMDELQKMAGEALSAHSNGLRMQQQQQDGEDENERELRKRLGGFIQGGGSDLGMAMQMQGPA
ncbi:hypothetical protein BDD12DRAFT_882224 [Trichophaea hybrida]|nr:hypothetical protein BDD12DRAFT_882224 [Trichophaea hybrida]